MTMEYVAHKLTQGKYTLKVVKDTDYHENPYEDWDFMGTIVNWHRRGFIGESWCGKERGEIQEFYDDFDGVILPIYLYEHSGQTINTGGFSCPWDSGQVGFIYVDATKIKKEYGADNAETREKAKACLVSEIKTLDDWLRGNVWGYVIEDSQGEHVDSCWGFIGESEDCFEDGKSVLAWLVGQSKKERFEKIKAFIRNKVPLAIRQAQLA